MQVKPPSLDGHHKHSYFGGALTLSSQKYYDGCLMSIANFAIQDAEVFFIYLNKRRRRKSGFHKHKYPPAHTDLSARVADRGPHH